MNYGIFPTESQVFMTLNDYSFSMALLAICCAFVFFLGWNNHS